MRRFLQKTIDNIDKMDRYQIRLLVSEIAGENDLLGMVLESMTDGVVVTDQDHRILLISKSAERMIPFSPGERNDQLIWRSIDDEEIADFVKVTLNNQDRVSDKQFTLAGGFTRTLAMSIMPLVRDGRIQGTVLHIEDITEKKAREVRLRRAENLAALTTLTAGVAHEIKNPLASIGIHLQLIRKAMEGKRKVETSKVDEYVTVISEEVERLNRIVLDFLFAVRPMNTELENKDINRVIRELVEFLQFELKEEGIEVRLDLAEDIPQIRLDESYMKQALMNMIKNAISAMPDGGVLTMATEAKGGELQLRMTDTGVGISDENLGKIFEPYFTTKDFGSGLGLTLVFKIIKEHLGEISISSREGEGTTFIINFPIPQQEKHLITYKESNSR